jgi:DNA-binding response OmpR family regulator
MMHSDNGKKRILIIEDDNEMRSLLKDFIEEEGYAVDSVENGLEALKKLVSQPFDLIITDIRMPGLTGLDILPRLKKSQPDVSIIVISAFGDERASHRAFERGATAYVEKPIDLQKLKTLIHDLISLGTICSD